MMNTFKIFGVLLISVLSLSAKNNKYIPEGTVQFDENLYVDKFEVSNRVWKAYVEWNKVVFGEESENYTSSLPDSSVWNNEVNKNSAFVNTYYRNPAFLDYPVVGISYEQVQAFCTWRSEMVNRHLYYQSTGLTFSLLESDEVFPKRVAYRLPTKTEWERVANVGFSEKTQKAIRKKIRKTSECTQYCFNEPGEECDSLIKSFSYPVNSLFPNRIGVYHILGNVGEMIKEKGIVKGGSYIHTREEVNTEKDFLSDKAEMWIGFRCVCERVNE